MRHLVSFDYLGGCLPRASAAGVKQLLLNYRDVPLNVNGAIVERTAFMDHSSEIITSPVYVAPFWR